ncbi:RNA polymerase sigma factor [Flavilitoribacter nigricans]|uniref:RNA polymerase sigma factor 70 region 4 type 2 domain-containing protein n=1 Tax=Flavilitoribacter nigricans (strain ATCC 23147 / DSM 23189 / NBRC 102662 / NCIMB 1420 / SS-2) TaxID=1122177 RepID=A0A2D0NCK0_FLAN2|nr:sigma-70 family RNA polymerase sigma factor [Flavilitoribacter nigricans]PHN06100.1 hypothetical protein CRP01_14125 [Flavilitoribacter nigricans DSM 23189 = NBRC 102662]
MERPLSETMLWDSFRSGNEDAFVRLFHLYSDPLFYYGCTITADRELIKDSIQELLCDLWERRQECPAVQKLKAFLFTGLRRIILRRLQANRRYLAREDEDAFATQTGEYPVGDESIEAAIIRQETSELSRQRLRTAIGNLPARQREAIHLRYYQGMSYEEMARIMEVKKGTIGRFIVQAIEGLRRAMDQILLFCLLLLTYLLS